MKKNKKLKKNYSNSSKVRTKQIVYLVQDYKMYYKSYLRVNV